MASFRIQPCILVSDKLTVDRAVKYRRQDIFETKNDDGSEDAKWETERHYRDREETKEAERVYSRARLKIRGVCVPTEIGFICPAHRKADLDKAIEEAKQIVEDANTGFKFCRVSIRVVCTTIEQDNESGVEVISEALTKSVAELKGSLQGFDPKAVQNTLSATRHLVGVLADPATKQQLLAAREEAKALAKEIAALVKEYDGNIANAMATDLGEKLVARASKAAWNF